ncbi:MAG: polysaccharide biosynthesis tyrosine autokinase [Verrucomicrobiota bacterium]
MPKNENKVPYGEGYGGYGDYGYEVGQTQRNLADYLVLLRERVWYIVIIFLVMVTGVSLYTFKKTKLYTAGTLIEIYRDDPGPMGGTSGDIDLSQIRSAEDLNTEINFLNSGRLIEAVNKRITGPEREAFMAPYEDTVTFSGPLTPLEILGRNRDVTPARLSLNVYLSYTHPDPAIAADIANIFAEEYVAFSLNRGLELTIQAVENLRREAEAKQSVVDDLEAQLAQYRRENDAVSIDRGENVALRELEILTGRLNTAESAYANAKIQWDLVQEFEAEDRPLWELDFISVIPLVNDLLSRRANAMINYSTLGKRYREKHPIMIEATENLAQIDIELDAAVDISKSGFRAIYEQAELNLVSAQEALARSEDKMLRLAEVRTGYNSILREFQVAQASYQQLISQLQTREAETSWKTAQAEIIDRAAIPLRPSSPNVLLNLALGVIGGLGLGVGFAFVLALLDNRVKSAYDVEELVGLPLLGIVPKIDRRLSSPDRARAVLTNLDSKVTESFRTIHSSISLSDEGKLAQVIAVTSTLPAEGKSFIATNLALTFAGQGQRTLIVDCDMRLPNVAKSFGLKPKTGMYDFFFGEKSLDEVIIREVAPNCDILPTERAPDNPTQVLNSVEFEQLLIQLRHSYHKIVIDSPPVGAVSDTLCLLPLIDGVAFVLKFNDVKKKAAKSAVRTLSESETPVFGAVMNAISAKMSNYYYSHYYDYSYHDYYYTKNPGERQSLKEKSGPNSPTPSGQVPLEEDGTQSKVTEPAGKA